MRSGRILAVVALLSLTLAGCVAPEDKSGGSGTPPKTSATPMVADDKLLATVKDKFAADPELSKEKIDVSVKDGYVTLKGSVSSSKIKMKAEDTARDASTEVFGVNTSELIAP